MYNASRKSSQHLCIMKINSSINRNKMKIKLLNTLLAAILFAVPVSLQAQAPNLGTAANFVLFTTVGAITNTGPSQITGHVGSNSGAATGFGNVNGSMYSSNAVTALCAADLATAYGQLNVTTPNFFPASPLGNGAMLTAGVYSLSANTILSNTLTLNAAGTPSAVFIFLINGTFSSNANAKVILTNGAQACNVFWKVEGAVGLSTGSTLRGTIIANNAAISISASVTLEGRALSTAGAISIDQTFAYTPIGCGSPLLTGPAAPALGSIACYAIFSSNGPVSNAGVTTVTGDIGSNNGLTTGFNPLLVAGIIHPIPDLSTAQCSLDLGNVYTYLNTLPADIILLYPAQFGNNLVLTPHTYLMNGAVSLTDSVFLNAQGNPNAIFVIQVNGAFTTNAGSKIVLKNGTQSKNVFWKIDGALSIAANSIFKGTFVVNNGAILLATGVNVDGKVLSTTGAVGITASTVTIPPILGGTMSVPDQTVCAGTSVSFISSVTGGTSYQWRKGTINLVNGGNISGATTATLVINPVNVLDAAVNYNVIISGQCGSSFTTANTALVVNSSPTITAQVPSQTVCAGSSATFVALSTGSGLTYQWRNGLVNLINSATITGVTSATLVINPVDISHASTAYNLIISGLCAPNFTTTNITLVVNTSPTIISAPSSQTVCAGSSVNFSVQASGSGLTYQWRNGIINLVNGGSLSGATSSVLIISPVGIGDVSLNYNVIISGLCAPSVTSSNVSLLVNTSPTITAQSLSQTVCAGSSVIYTVNAIGTGLTYQWRNGTVNLANSLTVTGVTTATLGINPVSLTDASSNYNVIVSGLCSPNFTSTFMGLTVNTSPTITAASPDQTICAGSLAVFTVMAAGSGLTFQWRNGTVNLINGGSISGVTTPTLNINLTGTINTSANYNVIVNGLCAPGFTSTNMSLLVNPSPTIVGTVASQTVCEGSPVSFSIDANGTGITYQWRNGLVNLVNAGTISGVTTASLTINPASTVDASNNYNVIVTGACAPNFTSANISLVVNSSPTLIVQAVSQTICAGSLVSFNTSANGTGLTYQWKNGAVALVDGENISGANSPTLTISPVNTGNVSQLYNLVVSNMYAPDFTSANVALAVNSSPTITTQLTSQTVCVGSPAEFTVSALGSGLSYQWRIGNTNLINGGTISGATSPTLIINPTKVSDSFTNYNLLISGLCAPTYTSANVELLVNLFLTAYPNSNSPVCTNSMIILTSQNVAGATYSWTGPNQFTSNLQSPVINSASAASGGSYSLSISTDYCTSVSASILVVVNTCLNTDFFIPEGFSPNGDGINDLFVIRGISSYPDNKFIIFNRWGNKVFEAKSYENNWDGTSSEGLTVGGNALPVGTYFYIFDLGDGSKVIKGTIYLNR